MCYGTIADKKCTKCVAPKYWKGTACGDCDANMEVDPSDITKC